MIADKHNRVEIIQLTSLNVVFPTMKTSSSMLERTRHIFTWPSASFYSGVEVRSQRSAQAASKPIVPNAREAINTDNELHVHRSSRQFPG